jgi:hypothetical protein
MNTKNMSRQEITNESTGISRRNFVKYALGTAALGIILSAYQRSILGFLSKELSPMATLKGLEKESFSKRIGDSFEIRQGGLDTIVLKLTEVSDIPHKNVGMDGEVFSLLFRSSDSSTLEQDTYTLENRATGSFPLFIVPLYSEGRGRYYEAIFNRLQTS